MLQYVNMVNDIKPDDPLYLDRLRSKVPNYRVLEMFNSFLQLRESLVFCNELPAFHVSGPILSVAVGGALHAIITEVQSATAANNFVKSLAAGANLEETSPIYKLREQLIRDRGERRVEAVEKLAMCVRAWNMYASNKEISSKRRIIGLENKNGRAFFPIPIPKQPRRGDTIAAK